MSKKPRYLFSWDEIPGNDSERLIDFLKQRFGIDWVITAKIEKIDNDKTIRVSTEKNFILLKLNNEKTELIIEIDDVWTDEFIAKAENDKLNIYNRSLWELISMDKSKTEMMLLKRYAESPLRPLMQLVRFGIGSAIDVTLLMRLEKIKAKRVEIFFDELQRTIGNIKPELLESEDFIHCFIKTIQLAIDTRRHEKIKMFARLLGSGVRSCGIESVDKFEEYLTLLAELSYMEIQILFQIEKFQDENPEPWTSTNYMNWNSFTDKLAKSLNLSLDELDMLLMRINRVGCSETFLSSKEENELLVRKCQLTSVFMRLKELIADRYP